MRYILTKSGEKKVARFIKECEALRKELLKHKKDTCDIVDSVPNELGILLDINVYNDYKENPYYTNAWYVTDNYKKEIRLDYNNDFID